MQRSETEQKQTSTLSLKTQLQCEESPLSLPPNFYECFEKMIEKGSIEEADLYAKTYQFTGHHPRSVDKSGNTVQFLILKQHFALAKTLIERRLKQPNGKLSDYESTNSYYSNCLLGITFQVDRSEEYLDFNEMKEFVRFLIQQGANTVVHGKKPYSIFNVHNGGAATLRMVEFLVSLGKKPDFNSTFRDAAFYFHIDYDALIYLVEYFLNQKQGLEVKNTLSIALAHFDKWLHPNATIDPMKVYKSILIHALQNNIIPLAKLIVQHIPSLISVVIDNIEECSFSIFSLFAHSLNEKEKQKLLELVIKKINAARGKQGFIQITKIINYLTHPKTQFNESIIKEKLTPEFLVQHHCEKLFHHLYDSAKEEKNPALTRAKELLAFQKTLSETKCMIFDEKDLKTIQTFLNDPAEWMLYLQPETIPLGPLQGDFETFGTVNGFRNLWHYTVTHVEDVESIETIKYLHFLATSQTVGLKLDEAYPSGEFRNKRVYLRLEELSNEALVEIKEMAAENKDFRLYHVKRNGLRDVSIEATTNFPDLNKRVQDILKTHLVKIASIKDKYRQLYAIAYLIQLLERTHSFGDGNSRVNMALLNKILMRHQIYPTLLANTYCLGSSPIKEFVELILAGQKLLHFVIHNKKHPGQGLAENIDFDSYLYDKLRINNAEKQFRISFLHWAAYHSWLQVPLAVLKRYSESDLNRNDERNSGWDNESKTFPEKTSLMVAAACNNKDLVKKLLELKVSVNKESASSFTAYDIARLKGHTEIAAMLLEKGAKPKQDDFYTNKESIAYAEYFSYKPILAFPFVGYKSPSMKPGMFKPAVNVISTATVSSTAVTSNASVISTATIIANEVKQSRPTAAR